MIFFKTQVNLFFHALSFFTRFPLPAFHYDDLQMKKSIRYFSFIGLIMAFLLCLSAYLLKKIFPIQIVIVLILLLSLLFTGGFHEDGLADSCDGLWGGMTPEKRLSIMKDSRLGSYGALSLIFLFLLKWQVLALSPALEKTLILSFGLSRMMTLFYMYSYSYHQTTESKSSSIAVNVEKKDVFINTLIALSSLFFLDSFAQFFLLASVLTIAWILGGKLVKNKIGHFNGDLFGASLQCFETLIMLCLLIKI